VAEAGKAQADALRKAAQGYHRPPFARRAEEKVPAPDCRRRPGCLRSRRCNPGGRRRDRGIASVDESAITGESAPVIRESGGDAVRSRVHARNQRPNRDSRDFEKGHAFLDRMIAMVEGASARKRRTKSR